MKRPVLLFLILVSGFTCFAQIKIPTAQWQTLLQSRKYASLFNEAKKLREKEYGKCAMVDYFIGKSLCGMGKTDLAMVWYSNILKNYKGMSDPQKALITDSKKSCAAEAGRGGNAGSEQVLDMAAYVSAVNAEGPSAGVRGKMGRVSKPCETAPQPLVVKTVISADEMESRLFPIDQKSEAVKKYRQLLHDPKYKVVAKGRFILITYESSEMTEEETEEVRSKLETAYQFFVSNFGLRPPDKLLAVYLLPERNVDYDGEAGPNILQQTAEIVHGISIPDENIGYSNIKDLSLLGIARASRIGTLFHELMHLMIRTDIGDVPPWMDEGLASIYETSIIRENTLAGSLENWRTSVLEEEVYKERGKIPHLGDFLNFSWSKFDGMDDNDICQTAINYAYAKHLVLFLENQGKLKSVFNGLKNRAVLDSDGVVVSLKSDIEIFESEFGVGMAQIEKSFDEWMTANYSFSLYHVDPFLKSETFLEAWTDCKSKAGRQLRTLNEGDEKRKGCEEIIEKLAVLKNRYDQMNPAANDVRREVEEVQEQQVQQMTLPGSGGLQEDHYSIAKREKKMDGILELRQELQEVIQEYETLAQE